MQAIFFLSFSFSIRRTRLSFARLIRDREMRICMNFIARKIAIIGTLLVVSGICACVSARIPNILFILSLIPSVFLPCALILRCAYLWEEGIKKRKNHILNLVNGSNATEVHHELLATNEKVSSISECILDGPLCVSFIFGSFYFISCCIWVLIDLGLRMAYSITDGLLAITAAAGILIPLWKLTRVDKFNETLRDQLSKNMQMPRTELVELLALYDFIKPRVSVLGVDITGSRILSLFVAFASPVFAKLFSLLMAFSIKIFGS